MFKKFFYIFLSPDTLGGGSANDTGDDNKPGVDDVSKDKPGEKPVNAEDLQKFMDGINVQIKEIRDDVQSVKYSVMKPVTSKSLSDDIMAVVEFGSRNGGNVDEHRN